MKKWKVITFNSVSSNLHISISATETSEIIEESGVFSNVYKIKSARYANYIASELAELFDDFLLIWPNDKHDKQLFPNRWTTKAIIKHDDSIVIMNTTELDVVYASGVLWAIADQWSKPLCECIEWLHLKYTTTNKTNADIIRMRLNKWNILKISKLEFNTQFGIKS